ncbi:hypothetical protein B0T22DRAFT_509317 [Podospora appendiculata]|uniref:Uncharacterized protein n=1 Tax=Podospora appendiculata TaxID=314037 RepID=A0AAE1CIP7_9PEZI|nr:hypothetical protein B0T22DRAFT_509317 [Podospora appendiculata]
MYGTYGTDAGSPPPGGLSPTTSDRSPAVSGSGRQQLLSFLELEMVVGHKPITMSSPETGVLPKSDGPRNPFSSPPSTIISPGVPLAGRQASPRMHGRLEPRHATSVPEPLPLPASVITEASFFPPSPSSCSSPPPTPTETHTTVTTAINHPSSTSTTDLTAYYLITANDPSPATAQFSLSNIYRGALTAITQSSLAIYDFAQRCAAERQAADLTTAMPSRHMVSLMLLEAANIKRKLEDVRAIVRDIEAEKREGGAGTGLE